MLCIALKLILDFLLFRSAGIFGISVSTAFCLLLYGLIMGILLHRDIGNFLNQDLIYFILRLGLPVAGMLAVILGGRYLHMSGRFVFLLPLAISGCVYLGIAFFSSIRETILVRE